MPPPRRAAAAAASAATSAAYAQTSAWTKGSGSSMSTSANAGGSGTHVNGNGTGEHAGSSSSVIGSARDTPQTEGSEDPLQLPSLPPDDADDDEDYTQPKATTGHRSSGRSSMRSQPAPLPTHTPRVASARTSAVAARSSMGSAGKGKAASASSIHAHGEATPTTAGKKGAGLLPAVPPSPPPSPIVVRLRQMWKFAALSQFLFTFDEAFGMKGFETEALENDFDGSEQQFIPELMRKMLYTLTLDRKIDTSNWQEHLRAQYLKRSHKRNRLGTHEDPIDWRTLSLSQKVNTMHDLCEWQLQDPELSRFRKLIPEDEESPTWQRVEPAGWDKQGNTYWLFDDNRLWIQHPDPNPPPPVVIPMPAELSDADKAAQPAKPPKKGSKRARVEAAAARRAKKAEEEKGKKAAPSPRKAPGADLNSRDNLSPNRKQARASLPAEVSPRRIALRASGRLGSGAKVSNDGWELPPDDWLEDASIEQSHVSEGGEGGRRQLRQRPDDGRRKSARRSGGNQSLELNPGLPMHLRTSRRGKPADDQQGEEEYGESDLSEPETEAGAEDEAEAEEESKPANDLQAEAQPDLHQPATEADEKMSGVEDVHQEPGTDDVAVETVAPEAVKSDLPPAAPAQGGDAGDEMDVDEPSVQSMPQQEATGHSQVADQKVESEMEAAGAQEDGKAESDTAEEPSAQVNSAGMETEEEGKRTRNETNEEGMNDKQAGGREGKAEGEPDIVEAKIEDEEEEEEEPDWVEFETVAVTREEWHEIGARFAKSRDPDEKNLHQHLHSGVLETVFARLDARDKEKAMEMALAARKRSSRIAIKESEKEEQERDRQARAEMEERMTSIREEEEAKIAKEREAKEAARSREERIREREERIFAREREIAEKMARDEEERIAREQAREERKRKREAIIANGGVPAESDGEEDGQSKSKKKKVEKKKQEVEHWELACEVCGLAGQDPETDAEVVACETCGKWQHIECWNKWDRKQKRAPRNWDEEEFHCTTCKAPPDGYVTPAQHREAKRKRERENAARRRLAKKQAALEGQQSGQEQSPASSTPGGQMAHSPVSSPMTPGVPNPGYIHPNLQPYPQGYYQQSPLGHHMLQRPPPMQTFRYPPMQPGMQPYPNGSAYPVPGHFPRPQQPAYSITHPGVPVHMPTNGAMMPVRPMSPGSQPPAIPNAPSSVHPPQVPTTGSPNGGPPLQPNPAQQPIQARPMHRAPSSSGGSGSFPLRYTPKLSPLSRSVPREEDAPLPTPIELGPSRASPTPTPVQPTAPQSSLSHAPSHDLSNLRAAYANAPSPAAPQSQPAPAQAQQAPSE